MRTSDSQFYKTCAGHCNGSLSPKKKKKETDYLPKKQFSSSSPSRQSLYRSHFLSDEMHCPSLHLNWPCPQSVKKKKQNKDGTNFRLGVNHKAITKIAASQALRYRLCVGRNRRRRGQTRGRRSSCLAGVLRQQTRSARSRILFSIGARGFYRIATDWRRFNFSRRFRSSPTERFRMKKCKWMRARREGKMWDEVDPDISARLRLITGRSTRKHERQSTR